MMMKEAADNNNGAAPAVPIEEAASVASTGALSDAVHDHQQRQQLFDLSLIEQRRHEHQPQQLSQHQTCHEESTPLPPMESLTMYTTDDDNTSVSSVSTQGSQQRRSMFSQYWKKTGQEPSRFLPRTSCGDVATPPSSNAATAASAFPASSSAVGRSVLATPPEDEAVEDVQVPPLMAATAHPPLVSNSPVSSRRSMFPPRGGSSGYVTAIRQSSSAPSLITFDEQDEEDASAATASPRTALGAPPPRKIRSYSHLLSKQPSSSCLRESRFSPNKSGTAALRRASSSTLATDSSSSVVSTAGSSVRFDTDVTVLHFELPQERYAHEGWSDYFQ